MKQTEAQNDNEAQASEAQASEAQASEVKKVVYDTKFLQTFDMSTVKSERKFDLLTLYKGETTFASTTNSKLAEYAVLLMSSDNLSERYCEAVKYCTTLLDAMNSLDSSDVFLFTFESKVFATCSRAQFIAYIESLANVEKLFKQANEERAAAKLAQNFVTIECSRSKSNETKVTDKNVRI